MNLSDVLKSFIVPIISVSTAVMVAVLNHQVSSNDLELRKRDQQLQESLAEIDLLVKQNEEVRAERESNQDFNLKIYEIVTESLQENNTQKQEAAKAFVVVMVDEPLRTSLLNVLRQGASKAVKNDISNILKAETSFKTNTATTIEKQREVSSTYRWGTTDFDIFWCAESSAIAKKQAEDIGEQLMAEGAEGRVRIRELPESINARSGYQIQGYSIKRNHGEEALAKALKTLAEKKFDSKINFNIGVSTQKTPWYLSIFVCPAAT